MARHRTFNPGQDGFKSLGLHQSLFYSEVTRVVMVLAVNQASQDIVGSIPTLGAKLLGGSSVGRAAAFDAACRWFEPTRPCHSLFL